MIEIFFLRKDANSIFIIQNFIENFYDIEFISYVLMAHLLLFNDWKEIKNTDFFFDFIQYLNENLIRFYYINIIIFNH